MCRMYLKNSEPRENTWYCFSWLVTYNLVVDCKLDLGEPSKYIIFHVFACLFILGEFSSLIALIDEVPSPKKREDSSHFWTVTRPLLFWPFLRSGPPLRLGQDTNWPASFWMASPRCWEEFVLRGRLGLVQVVRLYKDALPPAAPSREGDWDNLRW